MTASAWLSERSPAPPPRLVERMRAALHEAGENDNRDIAIALRATALHLMNAILIDRNTSRATALDLLTADALMTFSCEAACAEPATLVLVADASIKAVLDAYVQARGAAQVQAAGRTWGQS